MFSLLYHQGLARGDLASTNVETSTFSQSSKGKDTNQSVRLTMVSHYSR